MKDKDFIKHEFQFLKQWSDLGSLLIILIVLGLLVYKLGVLGLLLGYPLGYFLNGSFK